MNRRHFLQKLLIVPPAFALCLQGCRTDKPVGWADMGEFVKEIRKVILPSGDNINIDKMALEPFVMEMLTDCYSLEDKRRFMEGLRGIDSFCKERFGDSFNRLKAADKEQMAVLMNGKDSRLDEDSIFLYGQVKARIIQGFTQSELLLSGMGRYEMVPGRYNGHYKML